MTVGHSGAVGTVGTFEESSVLVFFAGGSSGGASVVGAPAALAPALGAMSMRSAAPVWATPTQGLNERDRGEFLGEDLHESDRGWYAYGYLAVRCCVDLLVALPLICLLLCHCFGIGLLGLGLLIYWQNDA